MKRLVRSRQWLFGAALLFTTVFAGGCVYVIVGGVAAAGGYAISPDTIQGEVDASFDEVWETAIEIVSIMGVIETETREMGEIVAIISGSRVIVDVIQLTPSTIRLKVKARKNLFPSMSTAQNVFVKIMDRVSEGGAS